MPRGPAERELAGQAILFLPGAMAAMAPGTVVLILRIRGLLGLPEAAEDVIEDPRAVDLDAAAE